MNFGLPKSAFKKESSSTTTNDALASAQAEVDRLIALNNAYGGKVQSILQAREDAINKLEELKHS